MPTTVNPTAGRDLDTTGVANPFLTYSNQIYPRTMDEVLQWAEWLWSRHGVYTMAVKRSIRYFLTELELYGDDLSVEERKTYTKQLHRDHNILETAGLIGDDLIGFGNTFSSITLPMNRSIQCPKCAMTRTLAKMVPEEDYTFKAWSFTSKCPACDFAGIFNRVDNVDKSDQHGLRVLRWDPRDIEIDFCRLSGEREYYMKVDGKSAGKIKTGDHLTLCTVPWEFIEAVKENQKFKFNQKTFRHFGIDQPAGSFRMNEGWGVPYFMNCFSQVVQLQMLERYDEAIATDWIVPLRYLTPGVSKAGLDPLQTFGMENFMGNVRQMVKQHKSDPTAWGFLPAPVDYNVAGGEGAEMQQAEQIERRIDILLTTMCVATEFYRGSVSSIAGPPIALKSFEKSWSHFTGPIVTWLNWYLECCSEQLGWNTVHGRLVHTSLAEDEVTKQVKLNLASSGVISQTTALKAFNIDPDIERERLKEEARQQADDAREEAAKEGKAQQLDEYMQLGDPVGIPPNAAQANMGLPAGEAAPPTEGGVMPAGSGGGMAPLGAVPGGGGGPTLDQMQADAAQAAQQMFQSPTRASELANMKKTDPTMHALVKAELDNMEQGIQSQALTQAKQQQPGGGM